MGLKIPHVTHADTLSAQQPNILKILGIDPGLVHLGFGLIEVCGRSIIHVCHGTLHTRRDKRLSTTADTLARVRILSVLLNKILDQHRPQHAALEAFSYRGPHVTSTLQISTVIGMVGELLTSRSIEWKEYATAHIKATIGPSARSTKHQISNYVARLLNLHELPSSEHASDALAIAITHARHLQCKQIIPS